MEYVYSVARNAFYPVKLRDAYERAGTWPTDGVDVDDAMFAAFNGIAPEGKIRAAGADGLPCWVDIPPLSATELAAAAEVEKQRLVTAANVVIATLADAVEFDMATDNERQQYEAWRRYRVLLTRVDTAAVPVRWPLSPEE